MKIGIRLGADSYWIKSRIKSVCNKKVLGSIIDEKFRTLCLRAKSNKHDLLSNLKWLVGDLWEKVLINSTSIKGYAPIVSRSLRCY